MSIMGTSELQPPALTTFCECLGPTPEGPPARLQGRPSWLGNCSPPVTPTVEGGTLLCCDHWTDSQWSH